MGCQIAYRAIAATTPATMASASQNDSRTH